MLMLSSVKYFRKLKYCLTLNSSLNNYIIKIDLGPRVGQDNPADNGNFS